MPCGAVERSREESDEERSPRSLWNFEMRRCIRLGSRTLPIYDGTTSAADATADADHDGRHEETRAGDRKSGTAVCELLGAGSRHGDGEEMVDLQS